MSEERQQMDGQIHVGRHQPVQQLCGPGRGERVFVLLNGKTEKVTIVVQHDAEYGYAAQRLRLVRCKQTRRQVTS